MYQNNDRGFTRGLELQAPMAGPRTVSVSLRAGCQTGCTTRFNPVWQPVERTVAARSTRLSNGCQTRLTTGLTTGWMFVYTIQPVVKPVVQPLDNRLYRVNGVLKTAKDQWQKRSVTSLERSNKRWNVMHDNGHVTSCWCNRSLLCVIADV